MQYKNKPAASSNRRKSSRENDLLYKIMIVINVSGWFVFIAALMVFHNARPEFISGVQEFWGVNGRREWAPELSYYLVALLSTCVAISLSVLLLKRKRNRREKDHFGINGYVLLVIASASLASLYFEFN